ncbi:D-alanyl-D-alanine carboxypeptidase family protein [Helcococcus sueciensis]|uniref:D-alanyl-D-alanine carboxypeptidase n=1 Tax=Helcococcus sueciensis TaxID=241555 RepID=UPI000400680C|nr:D-alanyl-D-alanine carboxypeptidase [Helcococcus sueciensis]
MKKKKKFLITIFIIIVILVSSFFLFKNTILQSRVFRIINDRLDFIVNTKDVKVPEDALSFSVYDIDEEKYLFNEGGKQLPTVASLSKLFTIDYAMTKVNLDDILYINDELLSLVPDGSSLANLESGEYTAKQIMQAMLVPSGNDAALALAYNIGKKDLGDGYKAEKYVEYFVENLKKHIKNEGYNDTDLFDPSGFSTQADTNLKDVNRVALKLIDYDFVKECMGESSFTIKTKQGDFTWKNTNALLDKNSLYYNENIKGVKTGTMASSYNLIALYEKDGKRYLITCLGAKSNKDRYKAIHAAIDTIIEK